LIFFADLGNYGFSEMQLTPERIADHHGGIAVLCTESIQEGELKEMLAIPKLLRRAKLQTFPDVFSSRLPTRPSFKTTIVFCVVKTFRVLVF
jgi:hypothetical protein